MTIHVLAHALHDALPLLLSTPIDCVITDPPYSSRVHDRAVSVNSPTTGGVRARDMGFASLDDALRADLATLIAHASRWSAVFSDIETAQDWRAAVSSEYIRTLPWVRWSQPQLSGDRPPSGCELVTLWHASGRKHWSGPGSLVSFDTRSLRGRDKFPCEKPLDLMLSLVSWFSDTNDVVCDPCCGSGTTGLACRLLGRDALLLDRDPATADVARERCDGVLSARDRDRAERWIVAQRAWLAGEVPDTVAGRERYARAQADTDAVAAALP